MIAVLNHLELQPGTDWESLGKKFDGLCAMVDDPDLVDASIVQTDDRHGFILVRYKSREAMDAVSNTLAAPWFAENVRPLLAAPASRSVGQIVGGTLKAG